MGYQKSGCGVQGAVTQAREELFPQFGIVVQRQGGQRLVIGYDYLSSIVLRWTVLKRSPRISGRLTERT
jgi:hypothetical protein